MSRLSRKTRLRAKSPRQRELESLHTLWRRILILQQGPRCQAAGKGTVQCSSVLQAHHIYGKGTYPRLRFDLKNGIIVCSNHHGFWVETGPVHEVGAWLTEQLGEAALTALGIKAAASLKTGRKGLDLKVERIYLEQELAAMGPE